MTVTYKDFLHEAKADLAAGSVSEIGARSSIGRSYYAFFHVALQYADSAHVPPISSQRGGTHDVLRSYFMDNLYPDKDHQRCMKRIGYMLKQLHENRCQADYDLTATFTAMDADEHVQRCEQGIQLVETVITKAAAGLSV